MPSIFPTNRKIGTRRPTDKAYRDTRLSDFRNPRINITRGYILYAAWVIAKFWIRNPEDGTGVFISIKKWLMLFVHILD